MKNILDNIKEIRSNLSYSQEIMAKGLDMEQVSYGLIENGKRKLKYETLEQIALIFNMNVIDVITYPEHFEKTVIEKQNLISIAADPGDKYHGKTINRIHELEEANKILIADNKQKKELIDGFISGSIIIAKKENEEAELRNRISELERELMKIYKNKAIRLGDMDGGLENAEIVKSKKGA